VLSPIAYDLVQQRPWTCRTVGWGHDLARWREIVTELRLAGYDCVMSIEHEDPFASIDEELRYAKEFLNHAILREDPPKTRWAQNYTSRSSPGNAASFQFNRFSIVDQ
jgi:hypothetical protein